MRGRIDDPALFVRHPRFVVPALSRDPDSLESVMILGAPASDLKRSFSADELGGLGPGLRRDDV